MGAIRRCPASASAPAIAICLLLALALIAAGGASLLRGATGRADLYARDPGRRLDAAWFRGVDGLVHVQYDLRLINGFPVNATIQSIEEFAGAVAACSSSSPVTRCARRSRRSVRRRPPRRPAALVAAFAFPDLTVADPGRLPKRIVHDQGRDRAGPAVPSTSVSTGARARVHQGPPLGSRRRSRTTLDDGRRCAPPLDAAGQRAVRQRTALRNRLESPRRSIPPGVPGTRRASPATPATGVPAGSGEQEGRGGGRRNTGSAPDAFEPVGAEIADGNVVILQARPRRLRRLRAHDRGASGSTSATACARATCSASSETPATPTARICTSSS